MNALLKRLITNDDSCGGSFYLMKKAAELKDMEALVRSVFAGKEQNRQRRSSNQTSKKEEL